MKKYKISATFDIHENSYKQGEQEYVTSFFLESEVEEETPIKAILKYFNTELYYEKTQEDLQLSECKMFIYTNTLVDVDNNEANTHEINCWKNGSMKLYNSYVQVSIYELKPTEINL